MESYLKMLPEDIVNKITLYNTHPVADLFKQSEAYKTYDEDEEWDWKCGPHNFSDYYFMIRRQDHELEIEYNNYMDYRLYCD